jgi:hypothetical protein
MILKHMHKQSLSLFVSKMRFFCARLLHKDMGGQSPPSSGLKYPLMALVHHSTRPGSTH